MTLRARLAATFAVILVLVAVQAGAAILMLSRIAEESALLVTPALNRVDHLAHLEADLLRLRTLEYSYLTSMPGALQHDYLREMENLRATINEHFTQYGALGLDQERADALERIALEYESLLESQRQVVAAIERGDSEDALREHLRAQPAFEKLDDQVHQLRHREYAFAEALRSQMVAGALLARWPLGLVLIVVACVELALGWHLSRSIGRSLAMLEGGARRIAREQFDEPVPSPPERELASLAATLNSVMAALAASQADRARLQEERLRLLRDRLSQVVRAQEEERARVSRELHDQAGQALIALQYGLDRLQRLTREPAVAAEAGRLVTLASDATRQIRALARDLRPAVLDDLGLVPALRSSTREFSERIGIPIALSTSRPVPRLSPEAETTVFRVVQEALTNVAKHAQAQHAWVELGVEQGQLIVRVRDDGRGFDPSRLDLDAVRQTPHGSGLGLAGIRDRVQLLGGTFEIAAAEGQGTQLRVAVPLSAGSPAPPVTVPDGVNV